MSWLPNWILHLQGELHFTRIHIELLSWDFDAAIRYALQIHSQFNILENDSQKYIAQLSMVTSFIPFVKK